MYRLKLIRWLVGGKYARVSGYFWGKNWVRMSIISLEKAEEEYSYGWPWARLHDWIIRLILGIGW